MPTVGFLCRRYTIVLSALLFVLIALNLPAFAGGPAPVQSGPGASGPKIWLQQNQLLPVQHVGVTMSKGQGMQLADSSVLAGMGNAQPVSMASGDLDADGFDDLVVGYSAAGGGFISIHRGNIDAFAPQTDASFQAIGHGIFPPPFHLEAKTFNISISPDFIAVGDFTGHSNKDLAVAAKGGNTLLIFANDGKGNFSTPQTVNLTDGVSSLAAGGFGASHMSVLIVGGSRSLTVYVPTSQGLTALAGYSVPNPVSNIAFGNLGDQSPDVAFLAGGKIQILHSSTMQVTATSLPATVKSFALGLFIHDRSPVLQIALLLPDGSIQIAVHDSFDPRVFNKAELLAMRQAAVSGQSNPLVPPVPTGEGWRIVENFPAVTPFNGNAPLLFRTRISGNSADDVMVLNGPARQMAVISHPDLPGGSVTFLSGQVSLRTYSGSPVAALPLRINVDGRPGVVAVHQGEIAPSMMLPLPDPTFNVDTTSDIINTGATPCASATPGQCSLRQAIFEANAVAGNDTIMVPAGTYTLTIADSGTDKHDATQGELSITDGVSIIGAVDGSGNPATIIQACSVAPTPSDTTPFGSCGGTGIVEKPFSINPNFNKAFDTHLTNLEIRFGLNTGTFGGDGFGGGFDWEASSTGNLFVTNCFIHDNRTSHADGGGITATNTAGGTGVFTISNSTVSNNTAHHIAASGLGGGIFIGAKTAMVMTNTTVQNNSAPDTGGTAQGGGIYAGFGPSNPNTRTAIHSSTISGNQAASDGGGLQTAMGMLIDQGTIFSNNSSGHNGGGIFQNFGTGETTDISKVAITGNSATVGGGGIHLDTSSPQTFNISFSRLANNTAPTGNNLGNVAATVTATNDWWGTNAPAATISGTVTFDPFIVLTHTGNPQKIRINQSSTLTGDMSKDNHGTAVGLANLTEIIGLPITFDSPVLGTIPQAQPETLDANAQATATFNAGGTAGFGTAHATVDQAVVPVNSNLIANATESGTTATIATIGAHGFSAGEFVRISGVGVAGYNSSPATQVFTILSTPTATTFTYTANASGLGPSSGGTANASIVILQPPSITKSFSPTTVAINTPSTITFSVTNGNVVPIDASFTDNLPSNVGTVPGSLVVASSPSVVNNCGGTVTATAGTGSISFSNTTLPVGTCTIQVNVSSTVDNVYSNSVTIDSTDAGNGNTSSSNLTVINPPSIAKSFTPTSIPQNGTSSLSFTITNSNVNSTLNGVAFTDTLPTGLTVASSTTTVCGGTLTTTNPTGISLAGATIAPGAQCQFSVTVTGATAGQYTNTTGNVSSTNGGTGNTATANLNVVGPPTISKSFSPKSVPLNSNSTLSFTLTNPNTFSALSGIAFTDSLPGGVKLASTTVTGSCGSGTITATINNPPGSPSTVSLSGGTLTASPAAGSSCTFSVNVTGISAGAQVNTTSTVSSTEGGTGGTASDTLIVVAPPTISKSFSPKSVPLNSNSTLSFTVTNPNTASALSGVAFTDTLPGGVKLASTTVTGSCGSGTITATINNPPGTPSTVSLSGGTLTASPAAGSSCTFSVSVTGIAAGAQVNTTGTVSSTEGGTGGTASDTLTVIAPPTISKSFSPKTIPLNGSSTLSFTVTNPNTASALSGVAFTDTLPGGVKLASTTVTGSCGSGTITATINNPPGTPSTVSLSGGTLTASPDPASSCTFSVSVIGISAGAQVNTTSTVSSTEGGTGGTATDTLTVVAPPTISKHFGHTTVPLNQSDTLSFTLTNPNIASALSGIAFTDTLPGGLRLASTTVTGSCGNGTITATINNPPGTPSTVSLSGGTLTASPAAGSSCTFSVSITGISVGAQVNTTSTVSSTEGGTGGTATDTITVVAPPATTKVFNPTTISVGGTSTMTITITNPSATVGLTGVGFTDSFPANLVVANPNGFSNTCNGATSAAVGSGTVSLTGGTIAANSSCAFTVNVTSSVSGTYLNSTGPISSTEGGNGAAASATLTVASPPSITKSFNPISIPLNGTSTLSFSITNPNTGVALSGVAFTDSLPSGVQVAATPNITGSCGSGTITATAGSGSISLSGGTLTTSPAAGSTCTFSVNVTGTTAGVKNNSVQVTSTEGGTGNTSNATLTVTQASTSTAVTSSSNPSVFGQPVTFTATVTNTSAGSTGAPTGSVQFVVDNVNFGSPVALTGASSTSSTATSAAIATLSVAGSPHSVSANYVNADGNFTNSSGSLSGGQTITLATTNTAVVSSSNPSVFGQSVTFTATVVDVSAGSTAQPTGSVQFVVDGSPFGPPVTLTGASSNSSTATSQATATLSIGGSPHSVTANYVNADGNFSNSTGSLSGGQVVNKANTTTAVTPSLGTITLGDTVTFTATVTVNSPGAGTPTGRVTFFNGATPIGSGALNNADQATFSTAVLPAGSNSITSIYDGDADFSASPLSSPITETVNLRTTTTGVVLNPTTVGAGGASTITTTVTDGGASTPPGTADSFTSTGAPTTGRTGFTSTLFADGLVLVAGGTGSDGTTVLNSAEVYSVSGGTFSTTGTLNAARTGAIAVLLPNGKVLIAGGSSGATSIVALQTAELFDPVAGTFTPTGHNMTAARFGATATLLNTGKVLIAGGQNSSVLNSAELYDPAADTFTTTGNLNTARTGHSATLLTTGKVLIAGGSSDGTVNGALNTAELFDPAGNSNAGTFTAITGANSTLSDSRWQPEAALLLNGNVLVAGGQNSTSGLLTSADVYDSTNNTFTASAHPMNAPHVNGSAVALPNGMVLLPGGTTRQTVDLYDADSDKFNTTGSLLHSDNGLVATQLNNGQVLVVGINVDLDVNNVPANKPDAELYSPSFNPLGTVGFSSSDGTDVFGTPCVLTPSSATASTCTSTVTPAHVGTSPHTITGTYPADNVHSSSSNSASLTVIPTAPPTIAKAFSQNNVAQNGNVNVSFTIVNPNPAATLTGISFTDALPAGLVVATPNNLSSTCGGTFTAVSGSSSLSLTGGSLAPAGAPPQISRGKAASRRQTAPVTPIASGQCVITVDLLVTGTGTISNTTGPVSANESGPGNPSNTATINVVLASTVNKAFGAASIPTGGTTSLTFNIANPNPGTALVGIALNDTLPSGLVVATPNGATGTCLTVGGSVTTAGTLTAAAAGGSVSLLGLSLNPSGSCSFSVNVTGTSGGTKNNTTAPITATFDDGSGTFRLITGGTASASITVVAPPVISKAFVPPAIAPGGISALNFTITNPAVNTVAEAGVAFTDTLPANVVVAAPNGVSGNCNGGTVTAVAGTGTISLAGGSVAAASSCVFSVNVTSSVVGSYTNTTGAVSSTNGGTGNTASATLTVANANLSITKTHTGNFPRGSTNNNYTITVSDSATAGPTVGTVTVTDTLPNSNKPMVPTAMSGAGWTCTLATLTCTRSDSLAPGASYPPITLTVTVPKDIEANVTNSATVSGGGDPNSHTANDPTHIGPPIDVNIAINNVTVNVGGTQFVDFTVDSSPGEGTINFACSGLPFGMTCSFNPPSTNQLSASVTMGITASAGSGALPPSTPGRTPPPLYAALLPVLGLMGLFGTVFLGRGRKVMRLRLGLAFAGLALLLALMGCGGTGHGVPPTPQGTFQVTVTATSTTTGDSGSAVIAVTVPQ